MSCRCRIHRQPDAPEPCVSWKPYGCWGSQPKPALPGHHQQFYGLREMPQKESTFIRAVPMAWPSPIVLDRGELSRGLRDGRLTASCSTTRKDVMAKPSSPRKIPAAWRGSMRSSSACSWATSIPCATVAMPAIM